MVSHAPTVFINYRSTDEPWAAIAVNNELSRRFGDAAVFLDAKSVIPGRAFDQTLLTAVRRSTVLLALMGNRWLTASDSHGRRLIDRPKDWVRQEIVEAFVSAVPVIPVLVGDVRVPQGTSRSQCVLGALRHAAVATRRHFSDRSRDHDAAADHPLSLSVTAGWPQARR